MVLWFLLLLSSLAHHAASALIDLNPAALNRVIPQCFTPEVDPKLGETNLEDCRNALLVLARTPDFTTPMRWSKNPRRGMLLPRGWESGDCLIFVSCENDRDAYTFRFADVLVVARGLVDNCVGTTEDPRWGLLRWGGLDVLGDSLTFYVSIIRPVHVSNATGDAVPVKLVNDTLFDPAIGVF